MQGHRQHTECILLVDSEVLVRHAIADYLRDCGYRVVEAGSSEDARAVICETGLPIIAVLCEAEIGGSMNGFELKRWARQNHPGLKVVLAGNVEAAANIAANFCEEGPQLQRPYDPQGVVDYIKRLLGTKNGT